jgi:uncharacterized protein involved in outer membrane biogenesis
MDKELKNKQKKSRKKFWLRLLLSLVLIPVLLFSILLGVVYFKQDEIVQKLIAQANEDFEGSIKIRNSHIEPFAAFPYMSIDFEDFHIYEGKKQSKEAEIMHLNHCYVDFNIWDILNADYKIKGIKLTDGSLRLIQHKDGSFNISNALKSKKPAEEVKEDFKVDLKSISMKNLDIIKINEENNIFVDAFVDKAQTKVKSSNDHFYLDLDAKFKLTIVKSGDTTFIKNKHFEVATELDVNDLTKTLTVQPTVVKFENSSFGFSGKVGLEKDMPIDLHFNGEKPNFDLIIAIAPDEIAETFRQFDNQGKVFFTADIKGKSANGNMPAINATFGCENAFFNNKQTNKTLDKIGFKGSFTNGKNRDLSTMKLEIQQFSARPEAGVFSGKIAVENFDSPDINIQLVSDFDLDFIAKFVNARELTGLAGKVKMTMNFHDIIDLKHPEKAVEKLNESYFTQLEIENLRFDSPNLPAPIRDVDMKATLKGHAATIEYFNTQIGNTDLHITGKVSDLPAIVHHTNIPVTCDLDIQSKKIDLQQLTKSKTDAGFDEQIDNLKLNLQFTSSAKKILESKNLPEGEFFVKNFFAKLKHYPHVFHDFHADIIITEKDFNVIDFRGLIDQSDFHFNGFLRNYDLWLANDKNGETYVEFDIDSKKIKLDNLFAYGGENYVPEDYRHEEIDHLKFHGKTHLHFNQSIFANADFELTNFSGKMKIHPLKFENFSTKIRLEPNSIDVQDFTGKMGHSDFNVDLHYNFHNGMHVKKNRFSIVSQFLDVDELSNYNPPPTDSLTQVIDHDAVFSLYDLPFSDMDFSLQVGSLNYHAHTLEKFSAKFHTSKDHMVHIDQLDFVTAEGEMKMKGYLSGKDKKHIYFSPNITANHVDIDKLMLKFDNFGQDHLVSENIHGYFNGTITGKIHLHADLVPKIDDSKIVINMTVTKGRLEKFAPLTALETYFEDKNVSKVSFDTLRNEITFDRGTITIPKMTINSTLGFLEISGTQIMNERLDMDYEIGVPWKMIKNVAANKLFRRKKKYEETEDEIQYKKENSKFVYVTVKGGIEDFKVNVGKKKRRG